MFRTMSANSNTVVNFTAQSGQARLRPHTFSHHLVYGAHGFHCCSPEFHSELPHNRDNVGCFSPPSTTMLFTWTSGKAFTPCINQIQELSGRRQSASAFPTARQPHELPGRKIPHEIAPQAQRVHIGPALASPDQLCIIMARDILSKMPWAAIPIFAPFSLPPRGCRSHAAFLYRNPSDP